MRHVLCTVATLAAAITFAISAQVKEIRSESDIMHLLGDQKPVVAKFYGPWCGPCQRSEKPFKDIAAKFADTAHFVTVNVDAADKTFVSEHADQGVPTFVIFTYHRSGPRTGKIYVGYNGADHLENWITQNIALEKKNDEVDNELDYEEEINHEPAQLLPEQEEREIIPLDSNELEPISVEPFEEHTVIEEEYAPEEPQPGIVGSAFGWVGDTVGSFFGTLFGQY